MTLSPKGFLFAEGVTVACYMFSNNIQYLCIFYHKIVLNLNKPLFSFVVAYFTCEKKESEMNFPFNFIWH